MRTTITLTPDVEEKIKAEMREQGTSFKEAVLALIRLGYQARQKEPPRKPFKVHARALGERPGLNYDNVWELIEQIEGPDYK
jgi:hypothetical protein